MAPPHARNSLILALLGLAVLGLSCLPGCTSTSTRQVAAGEQALASGSPREAVRVGEQALASGKLDGSQRVDAHLLVAEAYLALGNYSQATSHFRRAATPAATSAQRARVARGHGDVRYRQRDFTGAADQYLLTLDQSLGDAERREVHYRLAVCYRATCREPESRVHIAQSQGFAPAAGDPLRYETMSCRLTTPPRHTAGQIHQHHDSHLSGSHVSAWHPPSTPPRPAATTLIASGRKPEILPRSSWGAAAGGANSAAMGRIQRVTIHHSAGAYHSTSRSEAAKKIKGIQTFHKRDRGWADIGYHYVIDPGGRVWEGRPISVQGAHAGSRKANQGNVGIVLLGHFDEHQPSSAQKRSLVELVGWLRVAHGLSASAIVTHDEVRRTFTGSGTECPGKHLAGFVADMTRAPTMVASASRTSPAGGLRYRVRKGDTLFSIARNHGVSVGELRQANPGVSPRTLLAGSVVAIP